MAEATTVGVLALQGAFVEHLTLLRKAAAIIAGAGAGSSSGDSSKQQMPQPPPRFEFLEVRTPEQLARCDAIIIPGGESTTLAFVAKQTGLMEPLKKFVKAEAKPTWGTCAGLILLAEEATGAKKGGQELVGGLHVRAHRNHFGRQVHSFQADLDLPFLRELEGGGGNLASGPFPGVFIRAPVVEKILPAAPNPTDAAASNTSNGTSTPHVEVLGAVSRGAAGDDNIIAVRQGNIFATSFHPELTDDVRIHLWWLKQVVKAKNQGFKSNSV